MVRIVNNNTGTGAGAAWSMRVIEQLDVGPAVGVVTKTKYPMLLLTRKSSHYILFPKLYSK